MAAVYKKKYPIQMPDGAEIITRRGKTIARWTNGKGQERTAELLDDGRVQFVSDCWYIRYTDASGKMKRASIHCLRHTFATLLARNGVSPATAQKLMRHSPSTSLRAVSLSNGDIRLTMNIYTHLDLADTASAVAALPAI